VTAPGQFWTRWRVRLSYPVALAAYFLALPTPRSLAIGASISLLGLLLRAWAAGHLQKHERLSTSGPYAFTRNPLYLGSLLIASGCLLAGRSWLAAALFILYFLLFYPAVMRREEAELRARYAAAFDEYACRVPLFFPLPAGARARDTSFSWRLYRRNREHQAALGFLVGVALLALRIYWQWP